jgi:deoxyribodipyrimidine photolyase-like uncharacterized protein
MSQLVVILGDHLNTKISSLANFNKETDKVLMSEVKEETEPIAFEQGGCDASIDMVTIPLKALENYISGNVILQNQLNQQKALVNALCEEVGEDGLKKLHITYTPANKDEPK